MRRIRAPHITGIRMLQIVNLIAHEPVAPSSVTFRRPSDPNRRARSKLSERNGRKACQSAASRDRASAAAGACLVAQTSGSSRARDGLPLAGADWMPSTQPRETTMSRKDSDIKIDHATLNVYDLDVSEAFYREALGFERGARVASSSLICVDGTRRQSCAYALGAATRPVQNAPPWIASSGCRVEIRGRGESNQGNSQHPRRTVERKDPAVPRGTDVSRNIL
jgi:hypothetical protein